MQQIAIHCACRCDMTDGSAINDCLAAVQKFPKTDLQEINKQKERKADPSGAWIDDCLQEFSQRDA